MFNIALVALDGSPRSEQSLPWVRLLFPTGRIILISVMRPAWDCGPEGCGFVGREARMKQMESTYRYLNRLAQEQAPNAESVVREGSPAETVLNVASELAAELIAVTTRGESEPAPPILGGTTEQLLYLSPFALLVVPPVEKGPKPTPRLKNLLVPLDGSRLAEAVLPLAEMLAARHGSTLTLAHTLTPGESVEHRNLIDRRLNELAKDYGTESRPCRIVIREGRLPDTLNETAKSESADMMVLSAHGYGSQSRVVFGSTAGKLVRTSSIPLLLVKYEMFARTAALRATSVRRR